MSIVSILERWKWFFLRGDPPPRLLPKDLNISLADHCEDLYAARWKLFRPYVANDLEAKRASAAVVWNGFVSRGAKSGSSRTRIVPIFFQACYAGGQVTNDIELQQFLNDCWLEAYLSWLPLEPAL